MISSFLFTAAQKIWLMWLLALSSCRNSWENTSVHTGVNLKGLNSSSCISLTEQCFGEHGHRTLFSLDFLYCFLFVAHCGLVDKLANFTKMWTASTTDYWFLRLSYLKSTRTPVTFYIRLSGVLHVPLLFFFDACHLWLAAADPDPSGWLFPLPHLLLMYSWRIPGLHLGFFINNWNQEFNPFMFFFLNPVSRSESTLPSHVG